jgi:hypothetical protein
MPQRDPSAAYVRKATAARRVADRKCACGESRPQALLPETDPIMCYECQRKRNGKTTNDRHHPAGKSNDPITIPIPVNDHRAELSPAQNDWPKETLENTDGCPLLAGAGSIRGFVDTEAYLQETLLHRRVKMLEALSVFLAERLGPDWWINTEMEQFAPRR